MIDSKEKPWGMTPEEEARLEKANEKTEFGGESVCFCGKQGGIRNIFKTHFVVCASCRTYWVWGRNMMSSWSYEPKQIWLDSIKTLETYRALEKDDYDWFVGAKQEVEELDEWTPLEW